MFPFLAHLSLSLSLWTRFRAPPQETVTQAMITHSSSQPCNCRSVLFCRLVYCCTNVIPPALMVSELVTPSPLKAKWQDSNRD